MGFGRDAVLGECRVVNLRGARSVLDGDESAKRGIVHGTEVELPTGHPRRAKPNGRVRVETSLEILACLRLKPLGVVCEREVAELGFLDRMIRCGEVAQALASAKAEKHAETHADEESSA